VNRWGLLLTRTTQGKTRHSAGLPKAISGVEPESMPPSRILVIEERPDGYFLTRYSDGRQRAGNTWHALLDDAKGQAAFEFDLRDPAWISIPNDVIDPIQFVLDN
jgi:hypothetical protein